MSEAEAKLRSGLRDNDSSLKECDRPQLGPIKNRSCTDIICLFILVVFLFAWVALSALAFYLGDPRKLVYPTDSRAQICGVKNPKQDLSDKPFLFFFDLTVCFRADAALRGCRTPQVCVRQCPREYFVVGPSGFWPSKTLKEAKKHLICTDDVDIGSILSFSLLRQLVDASRCAAYYLESLPMGGRCVPKGIARGWNSASDQLLANVSNRAGDPIYDKYHGDKAFNLVKLLLEARDFVEGLLHDAQLAWWQILFCLLLSSILAFLWIYLMQCMAATMVYLSIALCLLILLSVSAYSWFKFVVLKSPSEAINSQQRFVSSAFDDPTLWFVIAIIFSIAFLIFVLVLCCLCTRIRLAIALIAESSRAVSSMLSSLFFPLLPFLIHLAIFTWWVSVAVYLGSSKKVTCRLTGPNQADPSGGRVNSTGQQCDCHSGHAFCRFASYDQPKWLISAQFFNLFMFLWLMAFASGFGDTVLAGAFASYYWAFKKPRDLPASPVYDSVRTTMRYHLGSIAFGSLILALIKFFRYLLDYLEKKVKGVAGSENAVATCFFGCLRCVCGLIERFMQFLNKNAFIMIAVYGQNFCTSAVEAFHLLSRNLLRVVVLDKITDFLIVLGKVLISVLCGVAAYFYFTGRMGFAKQLVEQLNYPYLPIVVVFLGSYAICCSFFGVYDMAVDTTFMCFLKDCEVNDGSAQRPYYMSVELREILKKKNVDSASAV